MSMSLFVILTLVGTWGLMVASLAIAIRDFDEAAMDDHGDHH